MPDKPPFRAENPQQAMDALCGAMGQLLTVSKAEIVKREREANLPARNGKKERKKAA